MLRITEQQIDELAAIQLGINKSDYKHQQVRRAYILAKTAHANQKDKGGNPYILHPLAVASSVQDSVRTEGVMAALLHDTVEDTQVKPQDIEYLFGDKVAEIVKLLTHDREMPYLDYVRIIAESGNHEAILIKIADITQNMNLARLPEIADTDTARINEKYIPAMNILINALQAENAKV